MDTITEDAIRDGHATDAYFERTEEALAHAGRNPQVTAEITATQFPEGDYSVFAGLKDAAAILNGHDIDVDALPEGTLFNGGPVMRLTGPYLEFARKETALIGALAHASGIATAALEARVAAPDTPILSFGARHVHPVLGATVERNALIGGLDGFSLIAAEEILDREASGTMPHALQIVYGAGNQEEAWQAFDEAVDEDVPRIALCDTYSDETDEVIRAVEALGDRLDGVRLDTTSSRRGDFQRIIREVRWELRERGHPDIDIYVSGGLGPADLRELRDIVDGFGVGGHVSNADPLDFGLDIVEVEGEPAAKRGKLSGAKAVYRTSTGHDVRPEWDDPPAEATALLEPIIRDGEIVTEFDIDTAADRAQTDATCLGFRSVSNSEQRI